MTEQIEALLKAQGFEHYGMTGIEKPISLSIYQTWIQDGLHGDMEYLKTHLGAKEDPKLLLPRARAAIVVARPYFPHPKPADRLRLPVALYARGEDYHHWFRGELEKVKLELERLYPEESFLTATDSLPVLERDLAYRAGLGWIGKNTCLIDEKRGSLFFLGEILTSLELTATIEPAADRCGTCTRCMEACPTGALVEPRVLDARKCISYATIEAKSVPNLELREKNSVFFYGCDICQTVCPWNIKIHKEELTRATQEFGRTEMIEDLKFILTASGSLLEKKFKGTPLTRASVWHHKANAIVFATNRNFSELRQEINEAGLKYEKLTELSQWSLSKLNPT
ncbi:MAG: tRNA epoxyqueuosine(34) reductase QueG [Bdellovibrionia bacterium]